MTEQVKLVITRFTYKRLVFWKMANLGNKLQSLILYIFFPIKYAPIIDQNLRKQGQKKIEK